MPCTPIRHEHLGIPNSPILLSEAPFLGGIVLLDAIKLFLHALAQSMKTAQPNCCRAPALTQ